MPQTYFHDIHSIVLNRLRLATHRIDAAIAWFTDQTIFDVLIERLENGVEVTLVLYDDAINKNTQFDWPKFKSVGGRIYIFGTESEIMHHKFCLIDNKTLLLGSYNWTYRAANNNRETMIVLEGTDEVDAINIQQELQILISQSRVLPETLDKNASPNLTKIENYKLPKLVVCKKEDKYTLVDKTGIIKFEYLYDFIEPKFEEGFIKVWKNKKYGFVNDIGQVIVPPLYDGAWGFREGIATVEQSRKWGCINKKGEIVIPFLSETAIHFYDGKARIKQNDKFGMIDSLGKVIVAPEYWNVAIKFEENMLAVCDGRKYGFVNTKGDLVIPIVYDGWQSFSEGLAGVLKGEKWGFVNKDGSIQIQIQYKSIRSFSEGVASVQRENKWYFIDKTGKNVIPFVYDCAYDFENGLCWVEQNGKKGYININGKIVIPLIYDRIWTFSEKGFASMTRNGKDGFVDRSGKEYW